MLVVSGVVCVAGCTQKPTAEVLSNHQKEVTEWFDKRVADLKGHDGWLNLAGLFWLKNGINSFGSDSTNDIVFPSGKISDKAGYFFVKEKQVIMMPTPASGLKETVVYHSDSTKQTTVVHNSLEWFIIRRDDKLGVRLRDLENENVKDFEGIERFPVDYSWSIGAKFEPAKDGETIDITNVVGQTTATPLAGTCVFDVDGKEQRLAATREGDKLFIVFGDASNGKETYGAGRFIYVALPDATGNVRIDFNKSYNPPCAFTTFATCPLPPKQNVLSVTIAAGEKNYGSHGK
jgi:uncharacterized protein (DUF1684 family)